MLVDLIDAAEPAGEGKARGRGAGTRSGRRGAPSGSSSGPPVWLNTTDLRYVDYFRGMYRKIQPLWRFPKGLEVQLEQGDVLVQFTVLASGEVEQVEIRKSSGFVEFDSNAVSSIRRAAPFGPLPAGMGERLEILAPFEFRNPLVR